MNKELEKRMYMLVPYNISPIQQAIQAGHAALEYAHEFAHDAEYVDFIENWKTWIILNGGTTNKNWDENNVKIGTLDQCLEELRDKININYSTFSEPDLNDALTAICLVADERVFNREDYPNFEDWLGSRAVYITHTWDTVLVNEEALRKEYSEFLGGDDIVFLRDLLNTKKLA